MIKTKKPNELIHWAFFIHFCPFLTDFCLTGTGYFYCARV
jgi:hypothetical protein